MVPRNQLIVGDAGDELRRLPDGSIDMVLTSPPYFRLRDYGVAGQLGLEAHVDQWVADLRTVTQQLHRVLTSTGSLWLNLGDSYATHHREGASRKSLLLAPERLALALIADGWILRNKVIWQKSNPMPTSVSDRLACTWEIIYIFAKQPTYYFDLDALRVPHLTRPPQGRPQTRTRQAGRPGWLGPNADSASGLEALRAQGRVGHPDGKNPGDVLRLASGHYRGAHHATFPIELASWAIKAGCPLRRCRCCRRWWQPRSLQSVGSTVGRDRWTACCTCAAGQEPGLVLDPFFGAGTSAVAAERLGRDWLGIELNPVFAELAGQRIAQARASPARAA